MSRHHTGRALGLGVAFALFVVGCAWPQARYGPEQTGANPNEAALTTATVGSLVHRFDLFVGTSSAPVGFGDRIYADRNAFDASGQQADCSGTPPSCHPVEVESNGGPVALDSSGAHVFVGLEVFNARATNCPYTSGRPCTPVWRYSSRTFFTSQPGLIADSAYYVPFEGPVLHGGGDTLIAAFDAAARVGCSNPPVVCGELWTYAIGEDFPGAQFKMSVADGVLYTSNGVSLQAWSASGTTNCSGAPTVCQPLWTVAVPNTSGDTSAPVVSGSTLFVFSTTGVSNVLYAFDRSNGVLRWRTNTTTSVATDPAVAGGHVFVGDADGRLLTFDAAGATGCGGTPKTCEPVWRTPAGAAARAPSVGGDVVYLGASDGTVRAFDANGTKSCGGIPKSCAALWSTKVPNPAGSPIVMGGRLYVPNGAFIAGFAP
jgi:hypothetical protein